MKIAVAFGGQGADAEALCRGMLQAQRWTPEARIDVWPVAGGALGCVEGGERGSRVAFKHQGTTGNLLLVTGTPISLDGPLEKVLASCVEESGENAAAALRALHGVYAAIFWDARSRRLIVVTDDLGMQPLHLHRSGAKLFLSTDIKGIATAGIMRITPDPQAWASFLSMGCSHGDRTLVSGIERCQPARVITTILPKTGWRNGHTGNRPRPGPPIRSIPLICAAWATCSRPRSKPISSMGRRPPFC